MMPVIKPPSPLTLREVEKAHIARMFAENGHCKSKTARVLGISRDTLYKKMIKHGLFSTEAPTMMPRRF